MRNGAALPGPIIATKSAHLLQVFGSFTASPNNGSAGAAVPKRSS